MKKTFRSLAAREFRLYFIGQCISLIGTWVQQVAFSWIVYRVTGSAFMLGLIAFSGQIPTLLLSPFSGALADRFGRRQLLLFIQFVQMALAALLAVLAWQDDLSPWLLVAASLVLGVTTAIEMPVRHAFTPDLVDDQRLVANAIALNSVTINSARLVGPAVAGFILVTFGEALCFALNALSFLATIYTLLAIHPRVTALQDKASLRETAVYLRDFPPARWLLFTVIGASLCLSPYLTFMPVYAKDILHGGPGTLGVLMAASGCGSLLAGLYLANRTMIAGLGNRMIGACAVAAMVTAAFAYNHWLWAALPLLVASGGATIMLVTSSNILLQSMVPDALRGRVMALYAMCFIGVLPLGSLAAGSIAHVVGVPPVFLGAAVGFAVIGLVLKLKQRGLRAHAEPVFRDKGLS